MCVCARERERERPIAPHTHTHAHTVVVSCCGRARCCLAWRQCVLHHTVGHTTCVTPHGHTPHPRNNMRRLGPHHWCSGWHSMRRFARVPECSWLSCLWCQVAHTVVEFVAARGAVPSAASPCVRSHQLHSPQHHIWAHAIPTLGYHSQNTRTT